MSVSDLKILKGNEIYRVGDLLNMPLSHKVCKHLLTDDTYKGTIMRRYLELNSQDTTNLPLLYSIVVEYQEINNIPLYDDSHVLIHIRMGDETKRRGLENSDNINFYLKELEKYQDKKIVIVTALHYGHKENSTLYTKKANIYNVDSYNKNIDLLNNFLYKLTPRDIEICSNTTDEDLVKLTMCKNLIATPEAGLFSKTVLELNRLHNELER